jgi:2-polyprenyl-6-methoxyphenol hydroxylase-like FAD-dependent oxidoreductase
MSRSIKRSILKHAAHTKGVANVNRHFSTIWARYQSGRYKDAYRVIAASGVKKSHMHRRSTPKFDKMAARNIGLRMAVRNALFSFFSKAARKPAARSGLA